MLKLSFQSYRNLHSIINQLILNQKIHSYKNKSYKSIKKKIEKNILKILLKKNSHIKLGKICELNIPFFSMGNINSTHLFGLDEIIIFCFYFINKTKYKIVYDLGANIGVHSIILNKLGYIVKSYEPDPVHFRRLKFNLKKNKITKKINLLNRAVSTKQGEIKFVKILNNTTGNHILGSKKFYYGKIKKINVKTEEFKKILHKADLVKMDIEGHEKDVILTTVKNDWKKTDAIVEIGSKENAISIFKHLKKIGINIFSQMKGWQLVKNINDMPKSHLEGSIFITKREKMNWKKSFFDNL
jgi:FkbM family methyltransferase